MNGAIRRKWKMPNDKPVWTGCWTAVNKIALGHADDRVFEYELDSVSTEPARGYTQRVGQLPIIYTEFDPTSSTLLGASFKKLEALRNGKVFPLLSGRHPAVSRRLYLLEVDNDNDDVNYYLLVLLKMFAYTQSTLPVVFFCRTPYCRLLGTKMSSILMLMICQEKELTWVWHQWFLTLGDVWFAVDFKSDSYRGHSSSI